MYIFAFFFCADILRFFLYLYCIFLVFFGTLLYFLVLFVGFGIFRYFLVLIDNLCTVLSEILNNDYLRREPLNDIYN